jgi:glycosyltransferase involved in cell wall biosynthesis
MPARFVYNGIDTARYAFKKEKGDRLLFVGRLSPVKRPHMAIEIARQLGMKLDIVGGSFVAPQEVQYMEHIKSMCDGSQIVMHADASHEEKVELMQNARCLIFPSNMGEPFGLCPAEAMSCGTGVVCSSDGAIPEVVENEVTGYVCHSQDEMLAAVKKMGVIRPEDCRTRVERLFSRRVMAENYVQRYREILGGDEW